MPTTPYFVEEPQHMQQSGDSLYEQEFEGPDHMINMKAQTLMLMANGAFKKPGGYNNSGRQQTNANFTPGPCFKCEGDHWVRDCPLDPDNKNQSRGVTTNWPRVIRYCADCGIEHLAKNCPSKMAEKPFNPTSLGIIEVIPSPVTSENESEPITLLAVNSSTQQTSKRKGNESTKTKRDEPLLQELTLGEKQKRTGQTSGSNSDTGSWDSIILETPEGVRRGVYRETLN